MLFAFFYAILIGEMIFKDIILGLALRLLTIIMCVISTVFSSIFIKEQTHNNNEEEEKDLKSFFQDKKQKGYKSI